MTTPTTLGSYRLIAELGHGGMADVFLAAVQGPAGSGFTKLAVIKKLRENLAEDPDFVAMLMDEARITARLSHPNVVQLFEVGQQNETYYLAIEYLEGQPLHRIGRRAKREGIDVPSELYYAVVSDVLAGLHHAHELADYDGTPLQVVHRDVTPHNIFVTYDGAVKVVDFGIAKAMGRATETQQGVVKGKVPYMSPEQVIGGNVDRRTDIFAVGVILWNAATGSKLWANLDELGIVRALCTGRYEASPRAVCPEVPAAIDAICRKALAFRPEDRYATAAEMRAELEAFLGHTSISARKKLESTMKQLFAPERVKLRAVLEAASLTSVASVNAFKGATASEQDPVDANGDNDAPTIVNARAASLALDGEAPNEHTMVMPGAPARPPREAPSTEAMAVSNGPTTTARNEERAKVAKSGKTPHRESRVGLVVAVTAAIAVVGLGVFIAISGRADEAAREAQNARDPAVVTTELTSFSRVARPKAGAAAASGSARESTTPGGRTSVARRGGANLAPNSVPAPPEPETVPVPTTRTHAKAASSSGKLDEADPWAAKNATQ